MTINWQEINQALFPLKGYEDACQRFRESFGYAKTKQLKRFSPGKLFESHSQGFSDDDFPRRNS